MSSYAFINGQPVTSLSLQNRGLHYGDGLFETIAIRNQSHGDLSAYALWDFHYQRLEYGCERLGLSCPLKDELAKEIQQFLSYFSLQVPTVIKLILTRGSGGRGYQPDHHAKEERIMMGYPWPSYPQTLWDEGIAISFSDIKLSQSLYLAGIKHLNRLEQVLAARGIRAPFTECVLSDVDNNVIEGTRTNIFAFDGKQWITPSIHTCGVKGVMRNFILNLLQQQNEAVVEGSISKDQLLNMEEIFVCNSVVGIWPVRQIEKGTTTSQNKTRKLMECVKGYLWPV